MSDEDEVSQYINGFLYDSGVVDTDGIFHRHDGHEYLVEVIVFAIKEDE